MAGIYSLINKANTAIFLSFFEQPLLFIFPIRTPETSASASAVLGEFVRSRRSVFLQWPRQRRENCSPPWRSSILDRYLAYPRQQLPTRKNDRFGIREPEIPVRKRAAKLRRTATATNASMIPPCAFVVPRARENKPSQNSRVWAKPASSPGFVPPDEIGLPASLNRRGGPRLLEGIG